jgi:hypothetical protein
VWVLLTECFEYTLGRLLGLDVERMLADYDLARGGFMLFGLAFMLLAPFGGRCCARGPQERISAARRSSSCAQSGVGRPA